MSQLALSFLLLEGINFFLHEALHSFAVSTTSDTMLNNSREMGHLCLVPALREEDFSSSLCIMILTLGLLYKVLATLRDLKMKTKLPKRSTKKTSPEKINDSFSGSQQSSKEIIQKQMYFQNIMTRPVGKMRQQKCPQRKNYLVQMKFSAPTLRSPRMRCSLVTERSETTNKPMSLFTKVKEKKGPLRTFDDLFVYFKCVGQESEIQIQEATKNQDKGTVLVTYYHLPSSPPTERGNDEVDGPKSIVSLSNNNFFLYVDKVQKSVQLKEIKESSLKDVSSEGLLFHLINDSSDTECRFECRETPGMWIGVNENQLTVFETEHRSTVFKINKY